MLIGDAEEKCVWQLIEGFDASCHFDAAFREGLASHYTAVGEVDHRGVCLRYDEQFAALLQQSRAKNPLLLLDHVLLVL